MSRSTRAAYMRENSHSPWGWYPKTYGLSGGRSHVCPKPRVQHPTTSPCMAQNQPSRIYPCEQIRSHYGANDSMRELTMQGSTPQSISRTPWSGTTGSASRPSRDPCRCTRPISNTPRGTATAGETTCKQNQRQLSPPALSLEVAGEGALVGRQKSTHRKKKNANVHHAMVVDHIATARVCNLRFRGIFDGTNLYCIEMCAPPPHRPSQRPPKRLESNTPILLLKQDSSVEGSELP